MLYARTESGADHLIKVLGNRKPNVGKVVTQCNITLLPQHRRPYKWLLVDKQRFPCEMCTLPKGDTAGHAGEVNEV